MAEDRFYLTISNEKRQPQNDGYIAVISMGSPQAGDESCTIMSVEIVQDMAEGRAWFKRQCSERPWEKRQ